MRGSVLREAMLCAIFGCAGSTQWHVFLYGVVSGTTSVCCEVSNYLPMHNMVLTCTCEHETGSYHPLMEVGSFSSTWDTFIYLNEVQSQISTNVTLDIARQRIVGLWEAGEEKLPEGHHFFSLPTVLFRVHFVLGASLFRAPVSFRFLYLCCTLF